MLFSICPLSLYSQKGRPYPIYLPPGLDRQHEVCHYPLHRSYAGSTKIVLHSGNERAPPKVGGWSTQDLSLWKHVTENKCMHVLTRKLSVQTGARHA